LSRKDKGGGVECKEKAKGKNQKSKVVVVVFVVKLLGE
jgi:hypothetical protein